MKTYIIRPLENTSLALSNAVNLLATNCPNESARYDESRLMTEVVTVSTPPFYKKFFAAYDTDGTLIGVGGMKSADWASDTHILYMMAVEKAHRGKGVGSELEYVRIQWLKEHFLFGRCLVSTRHKKRFERWGFKVVSEINDRHLMLLEF